MTLFSFIHQKKVRDLFWQALVLGLTLGLLVFFVLNASRNMREAGIASGFDFLWRTAGIEIPFVLTGYTPQSDNLALLWVGIVNTLLITLISAAAATVLGFFIGMRDEVDAYFNPRVEEEVTTVRRPVVMGREAAEGVEEEPAVSEEELLAAEMAAAEAAAEAPASAEQEAAYDDHEAPLAMGDLALDDEVAEEKKDE